MADENPVYANCLEPYSLVLRAQTCGYCGSQENVRNRSVHHLFGIIHCSAHTAWAQRDCNAYFHENNMVPLSYLKKDPILAPLLQEEDSFTVRRTSGALESGWHILMWIEGGVVKKIDGNWCLPFGTNKISKYVPVKSLLEDELKVANPILTPEVCDALLAFVACSEEGLYKADFEARPTPSEPLESPLVSIARDSTGLVGRVLIVPQQGQ